jgi:hypothetical protein
LVIIIEGVILDSRFDLYKLFTPQGARARLDDLQEWWTDLAGSSAGLSHPCLPVLHWHLFKEHCEVLQIREIRPACSLTHLKDLPKRIWGRREISFLRVSSGSTLRLTMYMLVQVSFNSLVLRRDDHGTSNVTKYVSLIEWTKLCSFWTRPNLLET